MPPIRPPRSEWDLLSNTKKAAPVPAKFFVPVQEENTIGVAQTGLKQLGGVVKCVHSARRMNRIHIFSPRPRTKLTRVPNPRSQPEPPHRENHGIVRGAANDETAQRPPETRAVREIPSAHDELAGNRLGDDDPQMKEAEDFGARRVWGTFLCVRRRLSSHHRISPIDGILRRLATFSPRFVSVSARGDTDSQRRR
jgi:hypothetical protein